MKVLVIQGPNLNVLGHRDPRLYGTATLQQIHDGMEGFAKEQSDIQLEFFQSNHEGELIDKVQECIDGEFDGLIINPGGLSHSSISLADAIMASGVPAIEVHLSNIQARDDSRVRSITAGACMGIISGFGPLSYHLALIAMANIIKEIEQMKKDQDQQQK